MKLKATHFFALVVLLVTATRMPAAALQSEQSNQSNLVFRVGIFDRSSAEFAAGGPAKPVNFLVGQSNLAKDWYAVQPAETASAGGSQEANEAAAPRTISFSLDGHPAGAYQILVSLLIESPSVPALKISIDGKQGKFYLHPKLDYSMGDELSWYDPTYSHADVRFAFPGSYLHQGVNTIAFQVVEGAEGGVPDANLRYDAIELDRDGEGFHPEMSTAQIVPTIFYRRSSPEVDQLEEMVDVFVRYGAPVKAGSGIDLMLDGKRYHQPLRGDQDFGEEKIDFSVPEFPAQTRAQVVWEAGGHRQHSEQLIDPKKKWNLFLVPHIHLDVGYTDYQAKVAAIQARVIDEGMDLTAKHPDFRFSIDGEWDLAQFMKTRTPADQERAITAIQKQELFIPAQYASLLTGFPTAETLIRSLYASADFSRVHGTPFNYANITDVPTYTWSYASILASAGIKYFLAGSDNGRGGVFAAPGRLNENSPFWWEGPDGKKVLFWYSRHYMQMQLLFGLPPLLSAGHDMLPLFLQQYEHPSYRANAAIIFGTQVENTDLFPQQAELAEQWNSVYAYPRLQYSGFYGALKSIADRFGNDIPTVRGDGGPYWEDGIAADAYYAAMERENESRGPSAEKLATLTALVNARLAADKPALDRMWTEMVLMDEHTWTSHNSVSDPRSMEAVQQLAVKDSHAINAHALVDWLARNSMASIADSISASKGSLIVFNPLNWERSGLVSIDLKDGDEILDPSTGQVVPVERNSNNGGPLEGTVHTAPNSGAGLHRACFVAPNIPAIGYKVFLLRHTGKPIVPLQQLHTSILESPYYRVVLDSATGSVRSIYDKQLQRELVNQQSPYRFGQYLYVTGGDGQQRNQLTYFPMVAPKVNLEIHGASDGALLSVTRTPYGEVARMESRDTNTPKIEAEIRLFDGEKKIEFVEDVSKEEVNTKEAVYFAFPFAMNRPQFQYEIQNGVVDPTKDMYAGAGTQWFSVQHWVSAQQDGVSGTVMPIDAALVTLGDIFRGGTLPTQFDNPPGTIFSYAMNNYWFTNYRGAQGGHFRFRYVVTSAVSTNATQLSRMGWEEMTPLENDEVTSQDKASTLQRPLDGKQDSFLDEQDPNLLLETWKPAEDGNGTVLRFLDFGGTTRTVTVQIPLLHLKEAWETDAVERNESALSLLGTNRFQFTMHPHEIVTVRIIGEPVLPISTI